MEKKTLLIVDDAPDNITFLKSILEEDYNIKAAINGTTALKILRNQGMPDLILLDVIMPDINGYQVCEQIKSDPAMSEIPIIFVTSNTSADEVTKGFEVGGVDYVTKPYNPKELMARIRTHLELKDAMERMKSLAGKLGKYLSPEVYNSIFSGEQEVKVATTKKPLTIFFSDIVDFTPQADAMSIDELTHWLNNYMNQMAEITIKHGGTLDKFIGDAVMVFFGDPRSKGIQEDALSCIQMAKEMVEQANKMNIKIRIGINSGECIVGNFGSDNRMDYTIMGKEVNTAQRLESNSEGGHILISEGTYELIKDHVQCRENGKIQVKGINRLLMTYWVN